MRETIVNDCVDKLKVCSCGNNAIKEIIEPDDFITGRMTVYYCSRCFEEWKESNEPDPQQDLEFLISIGVDPVEAEKMINLIYKKTK